MPRARLRPLRSSRGVCGTPRPSSPPYVRPVCAIGDREIQSRRGTLVWRAPAAEALASVGTQVEEDALVTLRIPRRTRSSAVADQEHVDLVRLLRIAAGEAEE